MNAHIIIVIYDGYTETFRDIEDPMPLIESAILKNARSIKAIMLDFKIIYTRNEK